LLIERGEDFMKCCTKGNPRRRSCPPYWRGESWKRFRQGGGKNSVSKVGSVNILAREKEREVCPVWRKEKGVRKEENLSGLQAKEKVR